MAYSRPSHRNERHNKSSEVEIDASGGIFASGTFKDVYLGRYVNGPRRGQRCVAKVFKDEVADPQGREAAKHFQAELDVVQLTQRIIDDFDRTGYTGNTGYSLQLNHHAVWPTFDEHGDLIEMMIEPYIEGFQKFNSNSGWVQPGHDFLQGLSHWSYHAGNSRYLLCDLQGGKTRNGYILTDPVIMTESGGFGGADMGQEGIEEWFKEHQCTRYCGHSWKKPRSRGYSGASGSFTRTKGTQMTGFGTGRASDTNRRTYSSGGGNGTGRVYDTRVRR